MTTTVVPYIEIQKLTQLVLDNYQSQYRITVDPSTLSYTIIEPRQDYKIGIEFTSATANDDLAIRIYINFVFDYRIEITPFKSEQLQNTDQTTTPTDNRFVCIALLPRSEFPILSRTLFGAGSLPSPLPPANPSVNVYTPPPASAQIQSVILNAISEGGTNAKVNGNGDFYQQIPFDTQQRYGGQPPFIQGSQYSVIIDPANVVGQNQVTIRVTTDIAGDVRGVYSNQQNSQGNFITEISKTVVSPTITDFVLGNNTTSAHGVSQIAAFSNYVNGSASGTQFFVLFNDIDT